MLGITTPSVVLGLAVALFGCDPNPSTSEADSRAEASLWPARFASLHTTPTQEPGQYRAAPIIDAHSHLFGPPDEAWPMIDPVMASQQIAYFFNLSGGSPRRGMTLASALAAQSGHRILNFMTVNWDGFGEIAFGDVVAAELELAVERYGYAGLKVSKSLGLWVTDRDDTLVAVDDPRLFPIWRQAGELGVPVFIHTSDPAAFWEPVTPANERFAELSAHPNWSFAGGDYPTRDELLAQRDHLLELFPDTTFVCVHFGNNPEDIDYVDQLLTQHPNAYVDIAARVGEIGRHDPERVREVFIRHQDRILFGTDVAIGVGRRGPVLVLGSSGPEPDTPEGIPRFYEAHREFFETDHRDIAHPTPIQGDWTVDAIDLPPEVLEKVYYRNAYDLVVAPWRARNPDLAAAPESQPTAE
jgi:predicted TIM-barrel fold metal-dependent hydrolase